jgi:hypothetical protein
MPETFIWRPEFPLTTGGEFETLVSRGERGKERRRSKRDWDRKRFSLRFNSLKPWEIHEMYDFYHRHKGALTAFYFWNPLDELVENGGFEDDFTGWTGGSSAIDTSVYHRGAKSSKLVIVDFLAGALSDGVAVNEEEIYEVGVWSKVTAHNGTGSYTPTIRFGTTQNFTPGGGEELGASALASYSSVVDWTQALKTIGPSGSDADIPFPAGTKFVRLRQQGGSTGSNITTYLDDVHLIGPRRYLVRFEKDNLSRELFTAQLFSTGVGLIEVVS